MKGNDKKVSAVSGWLARLVSSIKYRLNVWSSPTGCTAADARVLREANHKLAISKEWYEHRCEMLLREQKRFGDGKERTLLCDILANGQLLPDPKGKRYPSANK